MDSQSESRHSSSNVHLGGENYVLAKFLIVLSRELQMLFP